MRSSRLIGVGSLTAALIIASLAPTANAADASDRSESTSTVSLTAETSRTEQRDLSLLAPAGLPLAGTKCIKQGNLLGIASAAGKPVVGAKVRVYARNASGSFTRELATRGVTRTNSQGGFNFSVSCFPREVLVKTTGGRNAGKKFNETMRGLGQSNERGIVVTPATTIAAAYAQQHPSVGARTVTSRVRSFLKVVKLGPSLTDFGFASWVTSRRYSPVKALRIAKRNGGVLKFSADVARDVRKGKHRSFKPKQYTSVRETTKRPRTQAAMSSTEVVQNTLAGVASAALYGSFCTLTSPTPVGNFACPVDQTNKELVQISDQLTAISNQLTELQQSIDEIQDTLNAMEIQLSDIEAQNEDIIQLNLQQQAIAAAQNYQAAYEAAGVQQITQLTKAAAQDIVLLNATAPLTVSNWNVVPAGATPAQQCRAIYQNTIASNDQDPFALCNDYLTQLSAFADPANAYYDTLYNGLVGGASAPVDNLLLWTNQQAVTQGANAPVSQSTVAGMQDFGFQLEQLLSNAFAMYAAGQMFTYYLTTDKPAICADLTTSGLWPADTVLSVADPCNSLNSGLFAMSVQNAQANAIALPPAGTVADPRTNYIWWSYPVDITYTWRNYAPDPFYPGAPSGTYDLDDFNSWGLSIWDYNTADTDYGITFPLLQAQQSMPFWYASQTQLQQLFANMLLVQGDTVAESMLNQGFVGIGSTENGMNWTNIGADVTWQTWGQVSGLKWQSTAAIAPSKGCTGYPGPFPAGGGTSGYDYDCLVWYGSSASEFWGTFATNAWNLNTTSLPSAANVQPCQTVGTVLTQEGNTTTPATLCWTNTFTLMVDTNVQTPLETSPCNASTQTCAALPPFWSTYMLAGPPKNGVPAVVPAVPQVSSS